MDFNGIGVGRLPALVGIEVLDVGPGEVAARLVVRPDLLAPNGYLHAASVVALADTSCGYGTMATLPSGGEGFTTIELKTNFLATAREGALRCEAQLAHGGRTTQVWDARVTTEEGARLVALFRCTQLILYPRNGVGTPTAIRYQSSDGSYRGEGHPLSSVEDSSCRDHRGDQ